MSDALGVMAPGVIHSAYLENQAQLDCSPETMAIIDREIKTLLSGCYTQAVELLTANRALLDEIAAYLLVKETMTGEELMSFIDADKADKAENSLQETPAETE